MGLDERLGIAKEGGNERGANRPCFGCCTPHKEHPRATLPSDERDSLPSTTILVPRLSWNAFCGGENYEVAPVRAGTHDMCNSFGLPVASPTEGIVLGPAWNFLEILFGPILWNGYIKDVQIEVFSTGYFCSDFNKEEEASKASFLTKHKASEKNTRYFTESPWLTVGIWQLLSMSRVSSVSLPPLIHSPTHLSRFSSKPISWKRCIARLLSSSAPSLSLLIIAACKEATKGAKTEPIKNKLRASTIELIEKRERLQQFRDKCSFQVVVACKAGLNNFKEKSFWAGYRYRDPSLSARILYRLSYPRNYTRHRHKGKTTQRHAKTEMDSLLRSTSRYWLVLLIGVTTTAEESEITNKALHRYYRRWKGDIRRDPVVRSEAKVEDVELKDDRRVRTEGSSLEKATRSQFSRTMIRTVCILKFFIDYSDMTCPWVGNSCSQSVNTISMQGRTDSLLAVLSVYGSFKTQVRSRLQRLQFNAYKVQITQASLSEDRLGCAAFAAYFLEGIERHRNDYLKQTFYLSDPGKLVIFAPQHMLDFGPTFIDIYDVVQRAVEGTTELELNLRRFCPTPGWYPVWLSG
ncbi:hypothetical protein ANN_11139 [Periplaneta americana]|uniref:Uncharacterized protein n=1 Tax=Periplaneta americana TaxID=6978 RepID=A0ABQ8T6G8_PERAM|nr:hypothetical protein ANN_11139 [Periplaneta americana]